MRMAPEELERLRALDKAHIWHPFTPMADWCASDHDPLLIEGGHGAVVVDAEGREYIDGNSTIWTNVHGHNHPHIVRAIQEQAAKLAHVSFLGSTNSVSIRLAEKLVNLFPPDTLTRVFYSDDGSTAMEAALRIALQYWAQNGEPQRKTFVAFHNAYHGDTLGAASLGGIGAFHGAVQKVGFPVVHLAGVEEFVEKLGSDTSGIAGVIIEPLIQGAAGMRVWPAGMLAKLRKICDDAGIFLILDEVMTGFGRTGTMFACEREGVAPDMIALAKGLTGGTMPLAATLVTERIFDGFLGPVEEMRTFYYGHSYTGNPLGCAAALASLEVFEQERTLEKLSSKIELMSELLQGLAAHPHVRNARQCGFIAAVDVVDDSGEPYPFAAQKSVEICLAARKYGLLTRGRGNALFLLPPLVITEAQLRQALEALELAITDCCGAATK